MLQSLPNRDESLGSDFLEKWNAVLSGREECNLRVSSSRKFASREFAYYSVSASI